MYRANGPREIWYEHLMSNPASFATVAGQDADDWRTSASIGSMPARPTHATDAVAYGTQPVEDSWYARYYGTLSPAKVSASATGRTTGGQLT